jgi:hypothetical protein
MRRSENTFGLNENITCKNENFIRENENFFGLNEKFIRKNENFLRICTSTFSVSCCMQLLLHNIRLMD